MAFSQAAQNLVSGSTNTFAVNTTEALTMSNIKSVEIIVNLALSTNGPSEGFFQKIDSDNAKNNGCKLMSGRSNSFVKYKREDNTVFAEFFPLPEKRVDSHSRNNCAVVVYHMEDGTTKILDAVQTEAFWADVFGNISVEEINDTFFKVTVDLPSHRATEASKMFRTNTARAISIKFDGIPQFSISNQPYKDGFVANLRPVNANATYTRTTVGDDAQIISASNLGNALKVQSGSTSKLDVSKFSKSAKRRDSRRAQAAAARASVDTAAESIVMDFGGTSTVTIEPQVPAAPVVETPVVAPIAAPAFDMAAMIQQAVAAAIAPLTQEISSLREELKAKDAEIEALKAAQTQSVVEPVVVVESTSEVAEEPAVEETVEENTTTPKPGSKEWLAARRANAAKAKARKAAGNGVSAEDLMVDFE